MSEAGVGARKNVFKIVFGAGFRLLFVKDEKGQKSRGWDVFVLTTFNTPCHQVHQLLLLAAVVGVILCGKFCLISS